MSADGKPSQASLDQWLAHRFGDWQGGSAGGLDETFFEGLAGRRSHRQFKPGKVAPEMVDALCALALSAPSKSDLQQRDIIIVEDPAIRRELNAIVADQAWVADAPDFLVFCGNNRRQRLIHEWRGRPFANDHLDAFFNAAVDAGIALSAFVLAAEAAGLGCCPVSGIRNNSPRVCELLGLPDHVFAVAGLGLGWPAQAGMITPRLPLAATVHRDRYDESAIREQVESYDRRREAIKPYGAQRSEADYGHSADYGWSEDKARQYSRLERADFGAFVRAKGFNLK